MKNTFKILSYSKTRIALLMLLSCSLAVMLTALGGKILGETGLTIGGCFSILIGLLNTFITPKYLAKSELEIYCGNSGIEITCIKPLLGSKIGKIISVKYEEIKSYKFESTNYFSTFKIILKDGSTYKFHRWYNDNDDQFDGFDKAFIKNIKTYNNRKTSSGIIKREKSIFENRLFLIIVAIILSLMVLTTIILLFTKGIQNKSGFIFMFIFFPPLIWVSIQVIRGLKNN